MKLVQAQILFRHGARTPLHHVKSSTVGDAFWTPDLAADLPHTIFPIKLVDLCTNERIDISEVSSLPLPMKLPGGLYTGQLIKFGQEEAFELGKRLKQSYINEKKFISGIFFNEHILCRSTRILRTIISMRCVVAGMFGEYLSENKCNFELPVYVDTLEREFLFPNHFTCEVLGDFARDGSKEESESRRHIDLKIKLKKILGVTHLFDDLRPSPDDCPVYYVRDDYHSRKRAGFPIPPGMDEVLPLMHELSCEELYWEFLGKRSEWDKNIFVAIGPILRMILCNMKNYEKVAKFHLYSCHDSTLMLLLYALECFDGQWPPFSADLAMELYVDEDFLPKTANHSGSLSSEPSSRSSSQSDLYIDALWVRVLYMGKVQPLGCLWKVPYEDADRYNAGYVPLRCLMDLWSPVTLNEGAD